MYVTSRSLFFDGLTQLDAIGAQLIQVLEEIHANDIVHRDLSLSNIYVQEDRAPWVCSASFCFSHPLSGCNG